MAFPSFTITILCIILLCITTLPKANTLQTYIVHVKPPSNAHPMSQSQDLENWYRSFLPSTVANDGDEARLVYSYRHVFKGFAAKLSPEEVKEMEKKKGFISARPQKSLSRHTTRSPAFLGLNRNMGLWENSNYGEGVIIGVLDTGVFPEHPSFSDEGMPPPPAKWKGKCEFNHTTCNNKIIGARCFYSIEPESPLDSDGHGTHTAGTAAGNFVEGANVLSSANGTAAGIAPRAHLAIYKVCCGEVDLLGGMDAAIGDGVDVISVSLGVRARSFAEDGIAIGAYSAMEKGIIVSCAAGNSGPSLSTVDNGAPWILTVGASTIDRKVRATVVLGNNQQFDGQSLFRTPKDFQHFPLVDAGSLNPSDESAAFCVNDSLSRSDIKGKIVVCEVDLLSSRIEKGEAVKSNGGAGMILINLPEYASTTSAEAHVLPTAHVGYADGVKIKAYINSTETPTATISFHGTVIGDDHAPVVAAFSSRGPNALSPGILKPDILGPGVNILAASAVSSVSDAKSAFNLLSGTSMSCPHLSGVAALLKSAHPDWSPAAIKSAIMTTADVANAGGDPIEDEGFLPAGVWATGAGHVNPRRADDPGLVYDVGPDDFVPYLCGLNFSDSEVEVFLQRSVSCSEEYPGIPEAQLNYPSFSVVFRGESAASQVYTRTVTNVGRADSTYHVEVSPPRGVDVHVEPDTLEFSELKQKLEYEVTFTLLESAGLDGIMYGQGFLKWTSSSSSSSSSSSKYSVRSPIAVTFASIDMESSLPFSSL